MCLCFNLLNNELTTIIPLKKELVNRQKHHLNFNSICAIINARVRHFSGLFHDYQIEDLLMSGLHIKRIIALLTVITIALTGCADTEIPPQSSLPESSTTSTSTTESTTTKTSSQPVEPPPVEEPISFEEFDTLSQEIADKYYAVGISIALYSIYIILTMNNRCYIIEEAFSIIKNNLGTHFNPDRVPPERDRLYDNYTN